MSAAGYAGLSASLSGVRAVELVIAPQATRELSGLTIAIAVARGVANLLPPRWDPLFRRRLRSFVELGLIEAGPAPTQPTRPTKIELVLSMLPTHLPAAVVPVDLDQAGSRLFLQRAGAPRIPHFTPTLDHGALVIATDADRDAEIRTSPRTSTLALIAVCGESAAADIAIRAAVDAICAICGGTCVALRSALVDPAKPLIVMPIGR